MGSYIGWLVTSSIHFWDAFGCLVGDFYYSTDSTVVDITICCHHLLNLVNFCPSTLSISKDVRENRRGFRGAKT